MIPENRKVWQEFLHVFFKSPPSGVQLKSNWVIPDIDTLPILKLVQILVSTNRTVSLPRVRESCLAVSRFSGSKQPPAECQLVTPQRQAEQGIDLDWT